MFYTIFEGAFCLKSRLEKILQKWYPDGTKKGDTRYGNTPAGRAFHSSVLHKCHPQWKLKNMNAAEEIPTKHKSRADFMKARLPNDRTQDGKGMTPDRRIGGHFYWGNWKDQLTKTMSS